MKIVQILTELNPGGAEKVVLELSKELLKQNHEVVLCILKGEPENKVLEQQFKQLGIIPFYCGLTHFSISHVLQALLKIRKFFKENSPDLIHAHLMHPNLLSRFACVGLKIPLVNTIHISERRSGQSLFFLVDGWSSFLCDAYTAVSMASARFHESKIHLKKGKIQCVYNGVNLVPQKTAEELKQKRQEWGVAECTKVIGSVGRLDWQKGFDFLIRLLGPLSAQVPEGEKWGVVILGEGRERVNLTKLAESANFPNIIFQMPGFQADAAASTAAFDVFVMPSRYEGYGLVLAEAMNAGLPVVYNPIDSLPELCSSYSNATLAFFENDEKDQETVQKIVEATQRARCSPYILKTTLQMADEYLSIYKSLIR